MELTLENTGATGTAPVQGDSLTLTFLDSARQPLDVAPYLDRIKVMVGDVVLAQTIDPSSASGLVQMALEAFTLAPGTHHLSITLDLKLAPWRPWK